MCSVGEAPGMSLGTPGVGYHMIIQRFWSFPIQFSLLRVAFFASVCTLTLAPFV